MRRPCRAICRRWRQNRPRRTGWRGPKAPAASATARSSEKCSFRITSASSDTHTGIDAATTAASVPRSHTSASPMNAAHELMVRSEMPTMRGQQLARHLQILLQQHRKQRQPERADDAGQTARRKRRPFGEDELHHRKIQPPADRRDHQEGEACGGGAAPSVGASCAPRNDGVMALMTLPPRPRRRRSARALRPLRAPAARRARPPTR